MRVVRTEDRTRPWLRCNRRARLALGAAALLAVVAAQPAAQAQVPATLNGAPIQVTPYALEPGVPDITIPAGTPTTTSGDTDTGTGTGSGDSGGASSGDPLNTLLSQSWGATAVSEAEALGLNPSALAATCVVESGCQNVTGSSGAQGAFQMYPGAYQEGLQTALAADPALASQIVQGSAGMNDPATEAVAAAGYLMQAGQNLQAAGVSSPTVLDARGYYNFGPSYGSQLALADTDEPIANVLSGMSQSALTENGISPGETVGAWRAAVSAKIGNTANQPITA